MCMNVIVKLKLIVWDRCDDRNNNIHKQEEEEEEVAGNDDRDLCCSCVSLLI